ncbi:MAG TPA: hypothetical protein PK431_15275 [Chitinophagales bacterium]|nr:hypothetical protein [Chitinophagales bacterium]
MSKTIEVSIGQKFNYLTLVGGFCNVGVSKIRKANFECDCGKIVLYPVSVVAKGKLKSCGCKKSIILSKAASLQILHGYSRRKNKHPIYATWCSMISRCSNVNNIKYKNYGGRGIIVCDEWRSDFKNFLEWALKFGWEKGLTIERNNVNGDYEPNNCCWKTNIDQQKNTTRTINIEAFGENKCLQDWVLDSRCSISYNGLRKRIKKGMLPESAISMVADTRFVRTKIKKCG